MHIIACKIYQHDTKLTFEDSHPFNVHIGAFTYRKWTTDKNKLSRF